MRLVLSRKGFDSANGGGPSPILTDGRLCPLPIPDGGSPFRYDDLTVAGVSLGKLVADLQPKGSKTIEFAHLDPDLDEASMVRRAGWRPMFGQAGAACSHLRNQGVGVGDLFLFFGWFRQVELVDGRYRYVPNSPDLHLIYGWLQVGEVWAVEEAGNAPEWVRDHVHFRRTKKDKRNEVVFVSAERLALPGFSDWLPGAGLVGRFRPSLQLTAEGGRRSIWRLPGWFLPEGDKRPLSYHGDFGRWQRDGQDVLLKTQARGQEFVLHGEDYPKMADWLLGLLTGMINS